MKSSQVIPTTSSHSFQPSSSRKTKLIQFNSVPIHSKQNITIFNSVSAKNPTYLLFAMNQTTTMMIMITRRTLMMATAMMVSLSGFSVSEYKDQMRESVSTQKTQTTRAKLSDMVYHHASKTVNYCGSADSMQKLSATIKFTVIHSTHSHHPRHATIQPFTYNSHSSFAYSNVHDCTSSICTKS